MKWLHVTGFRDVSTATNAASTVPGTPTYDLFDVFAKVRVNEKFELRGGINNITDRSPPGVGGFNATNPGLYDPIGRAFFIGVRAAI
jgi:outer membrane receptor protein involved in Fe transport